MELKDLSGNNHTFALDFKNYKIKSEDDSKSGPQYRLGQMLVKIYGLSNILEDYPLPGCNNLSWDFWIPHCKIAFEYDGEQHREYNSFFHKKRENYLRQKVADFRKQSIADKNGIRLITLTEEISYEELTKLIKKG